MIKTLYIVATSLVLGFTNLSCKPRASGLQTVSHKSGYCASGLNPGVAFVEDSPWSTQIKISGWSDQQTYQRAVSALATKNVNLKEPSGPVIIAEAYPIDAGTKINSSSDLRWLAVYANEKLHIGMVSRSQNKYVQNYHVIPNIVVQKIIVEQHNESMIAFTGTEWNEAVTLNLSERLKNASEILSRRNKFIDKQRQYKTFAIDTDNQIYPNRSNLHEMAFVSEKLPSHVSEALSKGTYAPYVRNHHLTFADLNNGGFTQLNSAMSKDTTNRFNRGFRRSPSLSAGMLPAYIGTNISAANAYPAIKPGLNSMLIAKYGCTTLEVSKRTKGCSRSISYISEKDQSERTIWGEILDDGSYNASIDANQHIKHLSYSSDMNPKVAFADGAGVHILTKTATGSFARAKSFLTKRQIKSIRFLSPSSKKTNSDALIIKVVIGDRVITKLIRMKHIFGAMELGSHPVAANAEKEWRFEYFDNLLNLDIHKDGQSLIEQKKVRTKEFWNSRPREPQFDKAAVYAVRFDPHCRSVVSGGSDGSLYRWDILTAGYAARSGQDKATQPIAIGGKAHNGRIFKLDFSRNKRYLLSASRDNTVKIWSVDLTDINSNSLSYQLPTEQHQPQKEDFSKSLSEQLSKFQSGSSVEEDDEPVEAKKPTNDDQAAAGGSSSSNLKPIRTGPGLTAAGFFEGNGSDLAPSVLMAWKNRNPEILNYAGEIVEEKLMPESVWRYVHPLDSSGNPVKMSSPETSPMMRNSNGSIIDFHNFNYDPDDFFANEKRGMIASISDSGDLVETKVGSNSFHASEGGFARSAITITSRNHFIFTGKVDGTIERVFAELTHSKSGRTTVNNQVSKWRHYGPVMGLNTRAALTADKVPTKEDMDSLVSAGVDGTLRVHFGNLSDDKIKDPTTKLLRSIYFSKYSLSSLDVSADHDYAVTGTIEGKVLLWFIGETINLDESLGL